MADILINSLRFNIQILGSGENTVVFLHGLLMDNLSSFYFTFAHAVAQTSRVILFDMRGHGFSERAQSGYRVEDFVADLHEVLRQEAKAQKVHLVGNSFGGLVAISYAYLHPERIKSLVLIDSLLNSQGWSDQMVATLSKEGDELKQVIATNFKSWLGRHSEKKSTKLADSAREMLTQTTLIEDMRDSHTLNEHEISDIVAPTFLIYGSDSDMKGVGEKLHRLVKRSRLELFSGCSHSVMWEATNAVKERVLDWVTIGYINVPKRF